MGERGRGSSPRFRGSKDDRNDLTEKGALLQLYSTEDTERRGESDIREVKVRTTGLFVCFHFFTLLDRALQSWGRGHFLENERR